MVFGHREGRGGNMGISGKVASPVLEFLEEMGITVERQVEIIGVFLVQDYGNLQ